MENFGTSATGLRAPIIRSGDNIIDIVKQTLKDSKTDIQEGDIVAITESVVARSQNNYVSVDNIADDIKSKFNSTERLDSLCVVYPILSRNRFSLIMKSLARASKHINLCLLFPCDEVGNKIMSDADFEAFIRYGGSQKVIPESVFKTWSSSFSHEFTGVNYREYYRNIIQEENASLDIFFVQGDTQDIHYIDTNFIVCTTHTRDKIKSRISTWANRENKHPAVLTLSDICNQPTTSHGYNENYGLLGSNLAKDETLKLFPRPSFNGTRYVTEIQNMIQNLYKTNVDVLIYGDGAYHDPTSNVWELADPIVAVDYTENLGKTPNELKMKYFIDKTCEGKDKIETESLLKEAIAVQRAGTNKEFSSQGTTPRLVCNLIGSLCDLISGSGDKGTPVILIKNYFKNYSM